MSHEFNQNWGVEEMLAFIRFGIDETVQHCGWTHNGMVCNAALQTRDFNAHLGDQHGISTDAAYYQCCWHGCTNNVMTRAALERHIKERHVNVMWACPMCPERFTRMNTLRIHLNERCPGMNH